MIRNDRWPAIQDPIDATRDFQRQARPRNQTPSMNRRGEQRTLHDLFLVTVWIKGVVGLLQLLGSVLLLFVNQGRLVSIAVLLTRPELAEDPSDPVALFLRHSAQQFGHGTQAFASLYLAIHGLIKVLLVAGLLRRRMWSYSVSIWVLGAFVVYQCHRYTQTHSTWLVLLTALDIAVVLLVWREFRLRKRIGFY